MGTVSARKRNHTLTVLFLVRLITMPNLKLLNHVRVPVFQLFHVIHVQDISVEPPRKEMTAVEKLGDVEGLKLRLDKRLGSDELLKVLSATTWGLTL
jgi:hypothetical protein